MNAVYIYDANEIGCLCVWFDGDVLVSIELLHYLK